MVETRAAVQRFLHFTDSNRKLFRLISSQGLPVWLLAAFLANSLIPLDSFAKTAAVKTEATGKSVTKKESTKATASKPKITTLQEGWYRVSVGGIPAGYFVERIEFDSAAKQFVATTYLRTGAIGGNINESLKSFASETLGPISYNYTSLTGKESKTIDATFKKDVATLAITEGQKVRTETVKFKDGSLLSSMLVYTILRSKSGLKVGNNYAYSGIAEEDGRAYNGEAWIKEESNLDGQTAYKIVNKFKDQSFIAFVTPTGKVLTTRFPDQNIEMKLMGSRDEAVGTTPLNEKTLSLLFGELPAAGTPAALTSATPTATSTKSSAKPIELKSNQPDSDHSEPKSEKSEVPDSKVESAGKPNSAAEKSEAH